MQGKRLVGAGGAVLVGVAFAVCGSPTNAAPAETITYQGRLTDSNGKPLEGTVARLAVRIYSSSTPSAGAFLWGEVHENVPVRRGVFTLSLGEGTLTLDAAGGETPGASRFLPGTFASGDQFVEVQVDSDPPLSPLVKLGSVPFALSAGGSVPVGGIIEWFRPDQGTPVPDGWALCDGSTINDPASPFHDKQVPNLLGKFTRGAALSSGYGSDAAGAAGLPDAGGADSVDTTHTHSLGTHPHGFSVNATATTATAGDHGHTANLGDASGHLTQNPLSNHGSAVYFINSLVGPGPTCSHNFPVHVASGGAHSHSVTVSTSGATAADGGGSTSGPSASVFENRPAYVGLVKIIRIR